MELGKKFHKFHKFDRRSVFGVAMEGSDAYSDTIGNSGTALRWDWKSHCATIDRAQGGTNYKFTCKYCMNGKSMTGGATRMRDHLLGDGGKHVQRCLGVPSDVLNSLKDHVADVVLQAAAKK